MKTLDKEKEKLQKICDTLRLKTIEPANEEATRIVEEARSQAQDIIQSARTHAEQIINDAKNAAVREKNILESSLTQAARQSIEAIKQEIEKKLFNPELHRQIIQNTSKADVIAKLISAVIAAIEKEGLTGELLTYLPAAVSAQEVSAFIAKEALNKLGKEGILLGEFAGGARIRLEEKNITLDISDAEIEDLVKRYVRKDFRKLLFGS